DYYKESRDVLFGHEQVEVVSTDIKKRPTGAEYVAAEETHHWQLATFEWLGSLRQQFLGTAKERGYDRVFLVDSDLLIDPLCLQSLITCDKSIVSAVFWTQWQPEMPPMPQVWLKHPYGFNARGWQEHEFLQELSNGALVRVYGLGACTLIKSDVLDKVQYHPLLPGLPTGGMWQGEDRSFCIRAERAHVEMYADAWPNVFHCYRPSDEAQIDRMLDVLPALNKSKKPELGDFVSVALESTSEAQLVGHVEHARGKLGKIPFMEEIENKVLELEPGDEALVKVKYPHWHDIVEYRGVSKVIRVRLLGAKYAKRP
ncbi:hypothetical protein LCGC14_2804460, partial [marine sediment metagenome]